MGWLEKVVENEANIQFFLVYSVSSADDSHLCKHLAKLALVKMIQCM